MADERNLCEDYLELKPQQASCLDFVRILCCSCNITKREFINTTHEEERVKGSFRHRWIVFISVSLQRVFLSLNKPMAWLGWLVELLFNYPKFNGGFLRLLLNLITGIYPFLQTFSWDSISRKFRKFFTFLYANSLCFIKMRWKFISTHACKFENVNL